MLAPELGVHRPRRLSHVGRWRRGQIDHSRTSRKGFYRTNEFALARITNRSNNERTRGGCRLTTTSVKSPRSRGSRSRTYNKRIKSANDSKSLERTLTWSRIRPDPRHGEMTRQVGRDVLLLYLLLLFLFDLRGLRLLSLALDCNLVIRFGTYHGRMGMTNL